ncbi:MAG: glycosyltransferase [Ignavibacteriae bacterium]|nr:glycosyltransferase [Ignavibacteriota bacterium]
MEDEEWNNGGYPRQAVQMQEVLDLNITSSAYLRDWEIRRGGDPSRIEVCTTNIDTRLWQPDPSARARQRAALGVEDGLPVILFSGRIVAQKQPAVLLEAIRLLHARGVPFLASLRVIAILERLVADPALRARLGTSARRRVEQHFSLHHMGERMIALFEHARQLRTTKPRTSVAIGLGRSTALEALESHRNRPNRWWYTGVTDAAEEVIRLVKEALGKDDHATALVHLRALRAMFVRAEDKARVAMIDTRIAEIEGLPAAGAPPREDAPLVSVIIPCYAQAQYLREAMESVLAQTYSRWEMIVVNDGSPDNASDVARAFMADHPDRAVRLLERPNHGVSNARNAGARAATGDFLVPLDADDRIAPGFIATCLAAFRSAPEAGFVYTHIRRFGLVNEVFVLPSFDAQTVVHKDNTIAICALIRRAMWDQVGGYNEAMREGYEDWDFWVGCIEKGWVGVRIPEPLFEYRIKPTGTNTSANRRRMDLIARIVMNHPSLYEQSTRTWAEQHVSGTSIDRPGNIQPLRIAYLIHSIQGVTGGNQTLLHHANSMVNLGHDVTIVTYSEPPEWIAVHARVVRVPVSMPLAAGVPAVDAVIATYFLNAFELERVTASVKIYFAQGDQFIFGDTPGTAGGPAAAQVRQMRDMSAASYRLAGVQVVANSRTLQRKIRAHGGETIEDIVPVCVDHAIFHPLPHPAEKVLPRILIVGPDSTGTALEPLTFKGIGDIREALTALRAEGERFEIVRISNTPPEIFRDVECEFHQAPPDEEKTRLFGTADILVYASHYDSCPRPPLEGMAAGLAVVCTATEGAAEYCVQGKNALLVTPARPQELAAAVRAVLHDGDLRRRLRDGGRATADERPADREWSTMLSLIARALPAGSANRSSVHSARNENAVTCVVVPQDVTDGRSYARLVNNTWRESGDGPLCVIRDGVAGAAGWQERLCAVLQAEPACAAVAPSVLSGSDVQGHEAVRAFEERTSGRRVSLSTLPVHAWMLRGGLIAQVGLLDETLASIEAVVDDLAYRVLLAGGDIRSIGECAVTVPAGAAAVTVRENPLPVRAQQASDHFDGARREVLRACTLARALEEAERYEEAVTILDEAIVRVPESPRLHTARAWLLLRMNEYERVSNLLLPTPDSVKRDPVWLEIAGCAMQGMGETTLARQCADKALALDPTCARALVLRGMLAVDDGDDAAAIRAFREAVTADPSSAMAFAHLGALLWVTGERVQASSAIERAFILEPTHPAVLVSYREMVHESGAYASAVPVVRDACTYHPHHRTLAVVHAEILSGAGRIAAALEVLVHVIAEHGPAQDVLDMACAVRRQQGPYGPAPADGVSLCMIVRNEEAALARCLADATAFVDEIVVVDTGSTDRTVQVATACGAQVHAMSWQNDYAAARNVAMSHARGAWVLSLDADERLALADRQKFAAMMEALRRSPAGVVFTTRNYVTEAGVEGWRRNDGTYAEEAGSGWIPSDKVRLFPRDPRVVYEQPVHEVVEASLQRCGFPLIRIEIPVHHYGRLDAARTREKAIRYAEIGREKLARGEANDLRAVRELAVQEQELGNHAAAIPLWQKVVQLDPADARAFLGLGVSLAEERQSPGALEALACAMRLDPVMPEAPVKYALVALEAGDVAGAVRTLEQARLATPEYPFAIAAHAAALACSGDIQGAQRSMDELRRRGIDGRGFFAQVVRDLMGAGQDPLARSLMMVLQSTEGMAVAQ